MTAFNWSSVASNQILLSTDTLVIDDQSISAASVLVKWDVTAYQITTTLSSPTVWSSITYGTKTV